MEKKPHRQISADDNDSETVAYYDMYRPRTIISSVDWNTRQ